MTAPYDRELRAVSRVQQSILALGMRNCCNFYAQIVPSDNWESDDFTYVTRWTKTAGTTATADTHAAPDGTQTADTLAFAVAGTDYITNAISAFGACASKAFTDSVWLRSLSGTGTITLHMHDSVGAEVATLLCNLTTTWQRFALHKLFSAGATGARLFEIKREVGDLASVVAWRANSTENPGDADATILFPSVKTTGGVTTNASSCTAADAGDGSRCFYSFTTCQDLAHFNVGNAYEAVPLNGIREFKFCMTNVPLPVKDQNIAPYLMSYDAAEQKIDAARAVTESARITFKLHDDAGPGIWNLDKKGAGAKINTQRGVGTFWRRFLPIYKNYGNPACYAALRTGFVASDITEADYQQRFRGIVRDLTFDENGDVSVVCTDRLKLLKTKIPNSISQSNLLNGAINNSVTALVVDDASEVSTPAANAASAAPDYIVIIKIGSEEMNVTGVDLGTNTLTVQRGRWGTTAASHADNAPFSELVEFGTERTTPSLDALGKNPIDIAIELLLRAGLASADIDIAGLQDERDTWLPTSIDTTLGTETGPTFRRTLTEQQDIEVLMTQIREAIMLFLWVGEDQRVTGKLFAPARPSVTLLELTDLSSFVAASISLDDNDEITRITRVLVGWNPTDPTKTSTNLTDFQNFQVRIGSDEESAAGWNLKVYKTILSYWIRAIDTTSPTKLAQRLLGRFKRGARLLKFRLELKDDAVKLGDFVQISTARMQTYAGATDSKRIMQVTSKKRNGDGTLEYEALDTGLFRRYAFIAPAGTPDYDSASAQERRYGFIGRTGDNAVGTLKDPGYYIW